VVRYICLLGMKTELSKSKIYFIQSLAARLWVCVTDHVDVILPRALTAGITSSIDTGPYISDSLQLLNLELPSTWYPVGTTGWRWQSSYTGEMRFLWGQFFGVLDWYYSGRWGRWKWIYVEEVTQDLAYGEILWSFMFIHGTTLVHVGSQRWEWIDKGGKWHGIDSQIVGRFLRF